jgi:hypothetical protein
MATTYYTDIQKLYVAYFNRPADDAGLKYYEGILEAATDKAATLAVISADFAKSTEYTAAFSTKTSAEIVDIIYQNIFGHPADDAGKKYYADYLDSKALTVANVVTEVAKGAQGTDLIAFTSKVTAAAAFSAAIDTDAEKAGYSGDEANAVAKAWLAGVTDSLTLATVTAPAALNTTVCQRYRPDHRARRSRYCTSCDQRRVGPERCRRCPGCCHHRCRRCRQGRTERKR